MVHKDGKPSLIRCSWFCEAGLMWLVTHGINGEKIKHTASHMQHSHDIINIADQP